MVVQVQACKRKVLDCQELVLEVCRVVSFVRLVGRITPETLLEYEIAVDAKRIQYNTSKNSELAHAKVIVGRLNCITEKYISHYARPIGSTPTSGVRPNWWCYPRRKYRGEAIGAVHKSVHAQFVSWSRMSQNGEMPRRERLGQCNFGIPRMLKSSWQHVQGGVEDHWMWTWPNGPRVTSAWTSQLGPRTPVARIVSYSLLKIERVACMLD